MIQLALPKPAPPPFKRIPSDVAVSDVPRDDTLGVKGVWYQKGSHKKKKYKKKELGNRLIKTREEEKKYVHSIRLASSVGLYQGQEKPSRRFGIQDSYNLFW